MCSIDSGLWCWDATTLAASDDAPSQRRGWMGVLSFSFEVRVHQGRVTLPCKSLRGVPAPNRTILRTPLKPSSCSLYKLSLPALPSSLHNPFPNHNHIVDPPAHPNRTPTAQHNLSPVRRITSVSSAHLRLAISVSLANNLFTAITIRRTPFTIR